MRLDGKTDSISSKNTYLKISNFILNVKVIKIFSIRRSFLGSNIHIFFIIHDILHSCKAYISLSNLFCTQFVTFMLFPKKMFLCNYIADKKNICECISTGIALPNTHNKTIKLETILYPALV